MGEMHNQPHAKMLSLEEAYDALDTAVDSSLLLSLRRQRFGHPRYQWLLQQKGRQS